MTQHLPTCATIQSNGRLPCSCRTRKKRMERDLERERAEAYFKTAVEREEGEAQW